MSDAGFFPQLQLDYGIQTSCFLGSFTLEHRGRTAQPHISLVSNLCAIVEPTVEFGEDLCKFARFLHFESCLDNGYVHLFKVLRMHTDRVKAMGLQSREALLGSLYFEQLHDRKDFINVKLQNPALGLFQTMLFYILPTQNKVGGIGTGKSSEGFFKLAYSGIYPGLKNAAAMIDALDEACSETYGEAYRVAQDHVHMFKDLTAHGRLKVFFSSQRSPKYPCARL
ncbi:hypothetical protein LZ32DRAFT_654214 [Colletotrichum eremochloae]|nr:hypothetical protein LZ32DRAFT_654214 [Colletotrichum eremochloae]